MTQSIRVRRDGDLIVLDEIEVAPDHAGVLRTTYLDVQDAIDIFTAGLLLAREILREKQGCRT